MSDTPRTDEVWGPEVPEDENACEAEKVCRQLERELNQLRPQYVGIPEGWKLVPIDPTEPMLDALENTPGATCAYREMLAVAPASPLISGGE
jgi:hypothetical protein